jgi:hypothetical protein
MAHPYYLPKVLGKIELPAPVKYKCTCDDCDCDVDDSWGDPRVRISIFNSKDDKEPSAVRWVCESCADEQFGDHSPNSIFE